MAKKKGSPIPKIQDQCFDNLAHKFEQNIYHTIKGQIRQAIIERELTAMTLDLDKKISIADLGGGQGHGSLILAKLGFSTHLVDHSEQMLKAAELNISEAHMEDQIQIVYSSIQDFLQEQAFDFILLHAVLEWSTHPKDLLSLIFKNLKKGASLSLLFYNHYGLEMHHLLMGNFDFITSGMNNRKHNTIIPFHAFKPEEMENWINDLGGCVLHRTGVRVISDYLRDKENSEKQTNNLIQMELDKSTHPAYWKLGRYIHFAIQKI